MHSPFLYCKVIIRTKLKTQGIPLQLDLASIRTLDLCRAQRALIQKYMHVAVAVTSCGHLVVTCAGHSYACSGQKNPTS